MLVSSLLVKSLGMDMEYQSSLHKKLHAGNFVFTAETTPPDSSDKAVLLKKS